MTHEEVVKKAYAGLASMQMALGHCYLIGKDLDKNPMPVDYDKARYWLEMANDRGVRNASFLLGNIYEDGLGVDIDVPKAVMLYEKAAEIEHIDALLHLARIYAKGKGVPQNIENAIRCYKEIILREKDLDDSVHLDYYLEIIEEAKSYVR